LVLVIREDSFGDEELFDDFVGVFKNIQFEDLMEIFHQIF
jgi:hypothetical protein